MKILDDLKDEVGRRVGKVKDAHAARQERGESDVDADAGVAGSRAGVNGDGSYVGRESPQFDAEVQQSGAEARSEAARDEQA